MAISLSKKKINKISSLPLHNKIIGWGIIPLLLFAFWVILSFFYIYSKGELTVLTIPENKASYVSWKTTELLQGEKVIGRFIAKDNNLGIVAVRFSTFQRINNDAVLFRIRQSGTKGWYYENSYLVDQFQPGQLFTFGMPIIPDSLGKTYEFEIESVRGKPKDAIALNSTEPVFVGKYQYPKQMILSDREILVKFITAKILEALSDRNFIASSAIYILPLFFYFTLLPFYPSIYSYLKKKKIFRNKILLFIPLYLVTISTLVTIIFADTIYPIMIGVVSILWILSINIYKLKSKLTLIVGGIYLLSCPFLVLFSQLNIAGNVAIWAFVFLTIGILQQIYDLLKYKEVL